MTGTATDYGLKRREAPTVVVLDYKYSMAEKKEKQRQIDGKLKK